MATITKVTVNLPEKVWGAVERRAGEEGVTRTEILKRAISLENFVHETRQAGGSLVIERPDGTIERMVFPY